MPIPFPGMDPWLERPGLWPDVHENLIIRLQDQLAPLLRPRYYLAVQQRTVVAVAPLDPNPIFPDLAVVERDKSLLDREYSEASGVEPVVVGIPFQETITEDYLEVVEVATHRVVTIVEILSPSNKRAGEDREAYISKREKIFRAQINLVEIDLLRDWPPMPFTFLQANGHSSHYRILVKRGKNLRHAFLYSFSVRDPIPIFSLPCITEPEMAKRLGISQRWLQKTCRQAFGKTFKRLMRRIWIHQALRLMEKTTLDNVEIAQQLNYSEESNMARDFRKEFGYSPTEARKRLTVQSPDELLL
jgi:AraC-like DNA-binding protein